MTLNYDFDFFSVMPDELFEDPAIGGMMNDIGITADAPANKVACFRHPETAEALRRAPQEVRDLLESIGFGYNAYSSDLPEGFYPAEDEEHHINMMEKLSIAVQEGRCPKPDPMAEFDLGAFLETVTVAQPWQDGAVVSKRAMFANHAFEVLKHGVLFVAVLMGSKYIF